MVRVATRSQSPSLPPSEGLGSGAELSAGARVRQLLLSCPVLRAAPSCLPLVLSEGHFLCSPWCERGWEAPSSEKQRLRVSPEGLEYRVPGCGCC